MLKCLRLVFVSSLCLQVWVSAMAQDGVASKSSHLITPASPAAMRDLFRYDGEMLPIVSAHRGGSAKGYPENCIATFDHTLHSTFSMLEIDPRLTKDGEVVVHHDTTLERTTNGSGKLADKTLAELKQLRLKDSDGNVTDEVMPTLDEVIEWARGKTILVLDQKDVPLELRIRKIREHQAESYVMLIVGSLKDALACYRANPELMMEVMVPDHERIAALDASGIPWANVIAFVGHVPPTDKSLYQAIHDRGACCMIGTSRNLDKEFFSRLATSPSALETDYRELLQRGADIIETDLPREVGTMLFKGNNVPEQKKLNFAKP